MSCPTLEYLASSLWTQKTFADVQLKFEDENFTLHKVLIFQSPYLRRLLEQTNPSFLQISTSDSNITVDGLELCLASLYGIDPALTTDNVFNVLSASRLLELDDLSDLCIKFMQEHISPEAFKTWHSLNLDWEEGEYSEKVKDLLDVFLCRTASKETRHLLHSLPNEDLERVFTCNTLWVPTEAHRFELILGVFKSRLYASDEEHSLGNDGGNSSSWGSGPVERELSFAPSELSVVCASFDLNNCKSSTLAFFEGLLEASNVYYHNFSFTEMLQARKKAQTFGFNKIVDSIDKSLWSRTALERLIFNEAWKTKELVPVLPVDERSLSDSNAIIHEYSDLEEHLSTLRFSTEISDILSFSGTGQFNSEQVYFAGSLFRVVLSIGTDDEFSSDSSSTIGIYLQRTVISNLKCCSFADPRSKIEVLLEFIAGTNTLEVIELDGFLETPCSNRGYSKFLPFSQLSQYLSPTGTLRVTVILKMLFP